MVIILAIVVRVQHSELHTDKRETLLKSRNHLNRDKINSRVDLAFHLSTNSALRNSWMRVAHVQLIGCHVTLCTVFIEVYIGS